MEMTKDKIRILPEIIHRNGFRYNLVQRNQKKAIYAQYYQNVLIGFEVFIIRIRGKQFSPLLNRFIDSSERFPGNEDFGISAWSIQNYQEALKKYQGL